MKENPEPSYYAVIPASVLHSKNIKDDEKVLYMHISSLTNSKGYCWATNEYLAFLMHSNESSINRMLHNLNKLEFIYKLTTNGRATSNRRIYLDYEAYDKVSSYVKVIKEHKLAVDVTQDDYGYQNYYESGQIYIKCN